jgi:hypothetical protein
MNENTKILAILQVATPTNAPLTVASEIKILELLGIVKDPQLVKALHLVSALVPPSTPATLKGLVQLLAGLMRMSSKATAAHHKSISAILAQLNGVPDTNLTFGAFLSICQTLNEASSGEIHAVHHKKHDPKGK